MDIIEKSCRFGEWLIGQWCVMLYVSDEIDQDTAWSGCVSRSMFLIEPDDQETDSALFALMGKLVQMCKNLVELAIRLRFWLFRIERPPVKLRRLLTILLSESI